MLITKRPKGNKQVEAKLGNLADVKTTSAKTGSLVGANTVTAKEGVMPPSVKASFDSLKKKPAEVVSKTSESNPQVEAKMPSSNYLERVKARLKK